MQAPSETPPPPLPSLDLTDGPCEDVGTPSINVRAPESTLLSPYHLENPDPATRWALKWASAHPLRPDHTQLMLQAMQRWSSFVSEESIQYARSLTLRPGDVVIATHSKAGTTLVQQIVHQLRSGGDTTFDDISLVVPWMEPSFDMGLDLTQAPPGSFAPPRAFKTHFSWEGVPKTGLDPHVPGSTPVARYLCVVRDPHDLMASFYPFLVGWFFSSEELRLCDFMEVMLHHRGVPYWSHVTGWYHAAEAYPEQILFMFYEDLVAHRKEAIRQLADFIGFSSYPDLEARLDAAYRYSSMEHMKAYGHQFDDHALKKLRNEAIGAVGYKGSKVNVGGAGRGRDALGPLLSAELDEALAIHLPPRLDVSTYAELRAKASRSERLNGLKLPMP